MGEVMNVEYGKICGKLKKYLMCVLSEKVFELFIHSVIRFKGAKVTAVHENMKCSQFSMVTGTGGLLMVFMRQYIGTNIIGLLCVEIRMAIWGLL